MSVTSEAVTVDAKTQANLDAIAKAIEERNALRERVRELEEVLDPETLEAIADELDTFQNSARKDSLHVLAKRQRAALEKAREGR